MNEREWIEQMLRTLPSAEIGEDNDGQIVIYTGMRLVDGLVVAFDSQERTA